MNPDDQVHLNALRRALSNGNAAVMVGAGFSKNAEGGEQMKSWQELTDELRSALGLPNESRGMVAAEATQLAEQYARIFSTSNLEDLLRRHIPDARVFPGALHEQFMRLPWCEIFTTNYDTLLERAADQIFESAFVTVSAREDIPRSRLLGRRRIIKLHGSFPSQRPFIFTEEDYRTYPERFAPFVNTVRQSLLENVFCLIGFSGSDPNFLHWIGWVRDMLDRHTLPIYLFVGKRPSLGESKLLEARGVVAVTLPTPDGVANSDYAARHRALFGMLSEPIQVDDLAWGEIKWNRLLQSSLPTVEERLRDLSDALPTLLQHRKSYPDWLVAPLRVRSRLKQSRATLRFDLENEQALHKLISDSPLLGLLTLSCQAWLAEVLLEPTIDHIGAICVELLKKTSRQDLVVEPKESKALFESMGVGSRELERYWLHLALHVLKWMRQALNENGFNELRDLILRRAVDPETIDQIQYQHVLLRVYQGDRAGARDLVAGWNVKDAHSFMNIRRGMLLAEMGSVEEGKVACLNAIQSLRRSQRMQPGSARLLSREAWACVLAGYLKMAGSHAAWFDNPKVIDEEDGQASDSTNLDERLSALANRGHDVRFEINHLIAEVSTEASTPSSPQVKAQGFDLGEVSSSYRFGTSSEFSSKVTASFAWLELVELVGISPRVPGMQIHLDAFVRSGWWIQYADSSQRMLSILLRTHEPAYLKPPDASLPRHRTGWLSRYQVARMSAELAGRIADSSLQQVEAVLSASPVSKRELEMVCHFHAETFSRLVVRLSDQDEVTLFAKRVIALHAKQNVIAHPNVWPLMGRALQRSFEALASSNAAGLVPAVLRLPIALKSNDYSAHWVNVYQTFDDIDTPALGAVKNECAGIFENLFEQLQSALRTGNPVATEQLWKRLMWMNSAQLLSGAAVTRMKQALWADTPQSGWPIVPGHRPLATLRLQGTDSRSERRYLRWLRQQELLTFRADRAEVPALQSGRTAWATAREHEPLTSWRDHLVQARAASPQDMDACLSVILNWWDAEGKDLAKELAGERPRLSELQTGLTQRGDLVDQLIWCIWTLSAAPLTRPSASLWSRLPAFAAQIEELGVRLWRTRLALAADRGDHLEMSVIDKELASEFLNPFDGGRFSLRRIVKDWILITGSPGPVLFRSLIGTVATNRSSGLWQALDALSLLLDEHPRCVSEDDVTLITMGLAALIPKLSYTRRSTGTRIEEEEIPLLRFMCARLAWALLQAHRDEACQTIIRTWLESALTDPLPEMRLKRFAA